MSVPPSRHGEAKIGFTDLPEPFLVNSLVEWLLPFFSKERSYDGLYHHDVAGIRAIERLSRTIVGGTDKWEALSNFDHLLRSDPEFLVDALWFQVGRLNQSDARAALLDSILREGGLGWQVIQTDAGWELIRRVDDGVRTVMEESITVHDAGLLCFNRR